MSAPAVPLPAARAMRGKAKQGVDRTAGFVEAWLRTHTLLVYAFRDVGVARSTLLAFSVGMKLTLTIVNAVVGFTAIFLTLGTVRFRGVVQPPPPAQDAKPPT